ncbi:MAG: TIGR03546 family protein, partial [Bdellovibrionales bacterium]|nr:TIGR03546 family protein [Bdellovibrionales bacterium]
MTLILKQIFQLLKMLNSETGSRQIAWGVALGFILGMTPSFSLQTILVFLILIFFRVQMGAAFVTAFFFKFIAYLLDPLFHKVGAAVLAMDSLEGIFTTVFNMPVVPWTRFYNTIVMGSGVISIALVPVIYFLSLWFINKYREQIYYRFKESKFFKAVKATALYKWYAKYDEYYG